MQEMTANSKPDWFHAWNFWAVAEDYKTYKSYLVIGFYDSDDKRQK